MRAMNPAVCGISLLAIFLVWRPSRTQDSLAPSAIQSVNNPRYPNTNQGLQQLLEDLKTAITLKDNETISTLLKATEIPNCGEWLHKTYPADKADSWMSLCDPNERHRRFHLSIKPLKVR